MKHCYLLLVCLLLLASRRSLASNFCPLRPGVLHQYAQAPGDTTYGVQLHKQGGQNGSDSIYRFSSQRVVKYSGQPAPGSNCTSVRFRLGHDLFGQYLRIVNPGTFQVEYIFEEFDPVQGFVNQFHLIPYAAINQPWQADNYHMAQVTARGMALVLGRPDSVVTISLSGGRILRLSKTYGLVESPSPFDCATGRRTVRNLTLTALPTRQLGAVQLGSHAIYNFQPGDVFCYQHIAVDPTVLPPVNARYTYGDSVLSRTDSRSGDTIHYRIWRYFPGLGGTSHSYSLLITPTSHPLLTGPTGRLQLYTVYPPGVWVWVQDMVASPTWPSRRGQLRLRAPIFPCRAGRDTLLSIAGPDTEGQLTYGVGLGETSSSGANTTCCYRSTNLIGYRKGSEQWGTLFRLGRPLTARAALAAATVAALPNPFSQELALRLVLSQSQAVTLRLLNSLGQVVLEKTTTVLPGGIQSLAVPTAGLPAGIYTAQVLFGAEGRTETLKIIRQ